MILSIDKDRQKIKEYKSTIYDDKKKTNVNSGNIWYALNDGASLVAQW